MSGAFPTDLLVGGLIHMTAAVATGCLRHARQMLEIMLEICKKRIEWIFFQDFCSYLVVRAQVMIYSKVSPPEKIVDCDITLSCQATALYLEMTSAQTRRIRSFAAVGSRSPA